MRSTRNEAAETAWSPEVGSLAVDESGRVGEVMDRIGERLYLRPQHGGCEWEVRPDEVRPASRSEELSVRVAEVNARSRGLL